MQTCRSRKSYRIKWVVLLDENLRNTFADSVPSLFQEIPKCTKYTEVEWQPFKAAVYLLLGVWMKMTWCSK